MDFNLLLPTDYSNFGVVLLVGLVAGISTCGGLLSSFVLGISARNEELYPNSTLKTKLKPHLIFNLGRLIFFIIFGFLSGLLGQFLTLNNSVLGILILISSLILIILGLQILNFNKFLNKCGFKMPFVEKLFSKYNDFFQKKLVSNFWIFLIGGLTFFLPCGFTQGVQVYAISMSNPFLSSLTLFIFALATVPGLLALALASSFFSSEKFKWFYKLVGVIVIYFGFMNLLNSFNLLQINPFITSENIQTFLIKDGYQEVSMTQTHQGYFPNILTVKKDLPVKLIVNSKNNTTCASLIVMEKFNVRTFLELGENVIEFTPTEVGEFQFSCGMGMHPGLVKVIE